MHHGKRPDHDKKRGFTYFNDEPHIFQVTVAGPQEPSG
jgi:hypothetical protein